MYASTGASEVDHTACSARPRPFSRDAHHPNVAQLGGQLGCDARGVVDAGVVGDRDARRERKLLSQMAMKPVHRVGQCGLLVVHRHHDVEHGHAGLTGGHSGVRSRFEANLSRGATFEGGFGHDFIVGAQLVLPVGPSCMPAMSFRRLSEVINHDALDDQRSVVRLHPARRCPRPPGYRCSAIPNARSSFVRG